MNCPNCDGFIFDRPYIPNVDNHVQPQIDCVTGEPFIPVARVVNNRVTKLRPEDYICSKLTSRVEV